MRFEELDRQLATLVEMHRAAIGLTESETRALASHVGAEVMALTVAEQAEVRSVSPVALSQRLDELRAFQEWMDHAGDVRGRPAITRAQVVVQNYICFVYLKDACFHALGRVTPPDSVTARCCRFLTAGRLRSFRNAIAHANWGYRHDYEALAFWARPKHGEPLEQFEVTAPELNSWQALSRGVAYAAFSTMESYWAKDGHS